MSTESKKNADTTRRETTCSAVAEEWRDAVSTEILLTDT